jgi:adenylate kinase family enzyme
MDRIVVVGCGGSGKSVTARRLGDLLGLPVVHLDTLYYDRDWNTLPADQFATRQRELVIQPRWIIDGNYASTLPIRLTSADTIIFLDLGPVTCLWGVTRRRLRYRGGQHPEVGVYDRVNGDFVRYVVRYRKTMRPKIRALIDEYAPTALVYTPTSRREARKLIDELVSATEAAAAHHDEGPGQ